MGIKKNKALKIILFIIICAFFILFFSKYKILTVSGKSMEPTLKNNQRLLLIKTSTIKTSTINSNDIIVFNKENKTYIKRVIAKSGDCVKLYNEYIYINEVKQIPYNYNGENKTFNLKENQYFVIGDNYNNSIDSRSFGLIDSNEVIGKVLILHN